MPAERKRRIRELEALYVTDNATGLLSRVLDLEDAIDAGDANLGAVLSALDAETARAILAEETVDDLRALLEPVEIAARQRIEEDAAYLDGVRAGLYAGAGHAERNARRNGDVIGSEIRCLDPNRIAAKSRGGAS